MTPRLADIFFARSFDLAERTLRGLKDVGPEDVQELAERIQALCEETRAEYLAEDDA